jgi:hypothetical protein
VNQEYHKTEGFGTSERFWWLALEKELIGGVCEERGENLSGSEV